MEENNKEKRKKGNEYLALGICFGLVFGVAWGNIAMGLIFGVLFGLILKGRARNKDKEK